MKSADVREVLKRLAERGHVTPVYGVSYLLPRSISRGLSAWTDDQERRLRFVVPGANGMQNGSAMDWCKL